MENKVLRIKDIAKALGLSASAVSKALRGSHEISPETQKRVKEYSQLHDYKPNPIAQNLRTNHSKTIAVIVPHIDSHFSGQIISGILSEAYEKGYNVIVTQTRESYEREVTIVKHHFSRSVDGIIAALSTETKNLMHFDSIYKKNTPLVFYDRVPKETETHTITSNNFAGAYKATVHLIKQGYTRIAHIATARQLSICTERLEGYTTALKEYKLPVKKEYIKYCAHGGMLKEEAEEAIHALLWLRKRPDAIFAASDRLSILTLRILGHLNIQVPKDIALAGFTNSTNADVYNPALTCVVQQAFKMGEMAARLLIKTIESRKPVNIEHVVLDTELVIRTSSLKS